MSLSDALLQNDKDTTAQRGLNLDAGEPLPLKGFQSQQYEMINESISHLESIHNSSCNIYATNVEFL